MVNDVADRSVIALRVFLVTLEANIAKGQWPDVKGLQSIAKGSVEAAEVLLAALNQEQKP